MESTTSSSSASNVFVKSTGKWDYGYTVDKDGKNWPWIRLNTTVKTKMVWRDTMRVEGPDGKVRRVNYGHWVEVPDYPESPHKGER